MSDEKEVSAGISAGAALAIKRKRYLKTCVVCGDEFEGIATAKTCSVACRKQKSRKGQKK